MKVALLLFLQLAVTLAAKSESDGASTPDKRSRVEVRAVFINCEADESQAMDSEINRFLRQELFKHNALQDCNKKLVLTVKMASDPDQKPDKDEYIPIGHVFEGPNRKRVRLLNPYILRLQRDPPLQAYKLNRIETVCGTLTTSDKENLKKKLKKHKWHRGQRDLARLSEAEEWSRALGPAAVCPKFTLEHDQRGRHSYSVRIGNADDVIVSETSATTEAVTQYDFKDCGFRLFNDAAINTSQQCSRSGMQAKRQPTNRTVIDPRTYDRTPLSSPPHNYSRANKDVRSTSNETLIRSKRHEEDTLEIMRAKDTDDPLHQVQNKHINIRSAHNKMINANPKHTHKKLRFHLSSNDRTLIKETSTVDTERANADKALLEFEESDIDKDNMSIKPDAFDYKNQDPDDLNDIPVPSAKPNATNNFESKERHFALYKIGNANLWYSVRVQLFEKLSSFDGKTVWNDLTKGVPASVNSTNSEWVSHNMNLRYRPAEWVPRDDFALPVSSLCLLQPIRNDGNYNDFEEYIIVPMEDVIGVDDGRGTLKKQDENFTTAATTSEESHRRVEVRVARALFGNSGDGFRVAAQGYDEFLTMPHRHSHLAQIDVEVRADDNQLVRVGSSGRIMTVVADNTRKSRTVLTLQITNTGLASARFRAMARDCGPELSGLLNEKDCEGIVSSSILLPPMHTRRLQLQLPIEIPLDLVHCSVVMVNDKDEDVAVRDVAIKQGDRCFCVWHCDCVCLSDDPTLLCREMSPAQQSAAGVTRRERPRASRSVCYTDDINMDLCVVVAGVLTLMLLLGLIKACLGVVHRGAATWGLERLMAMPRRMEHYLESELRHRCMRCDCDGYPVHPDTGLRSVRLVSKPTEFILNLMFFLMFPCVILYDIGKYLYSRCRNVTHKISSGSVCDDKTCYSSHDMQCSTLQLKRQSRGGMRRWMSPQAEELSIDIWHKGLAPYGPTKVELMRPLLVEKSDSRSGEASEGDSEQDDTEYVLMQMQKSRESLAKSQRKLKGHDPSPQSARTQRKGKPEPSARQ